MSWSQALAKANSQVEDCVILAKRYVLPWWGATLAEFPTPLHGSVHSLYVAHECSQKYMLNGKRTFAPSRFLLTNYPEAGPDNLTCQKGKDDEVGRLGINPYDIRSHFWASQEAFWEGKDWVEPILKKLGFAQFDKLSMIDQLALLLLPRAIGIGATKGLLRKGAKYTNVAGLMNKIEVWISTPFADTTPFDGSQDTESVQLRFAWCTRMILAAHCVGLGNLPLTLLPPALKPFNLVPLPKDFYVNMKAYSNRARREGPAPTGPWPV